MAAIGSAITFFIYAVLGGYTLYWLMRYLTAATITSKDSFLPKALIGTGVLACFAGKMHYNQQLAEAECIGIYQLSSYPNCPNCVLALQPHNYYEIRQGPVIKEHGPWRYENGDDYWIIYLNEDDQLGVGPYSYHDYILRGK